MARHHRHYKHQQWRKWRVKQQQALKRNAIAENERSNGARM